MTVVRYHTTVGRANGGMRIIKRQLPAPQAQGAGSSASFDHLKMIQGDGDEGVADLAGGHELGDVGDGHQLGDDVLGVVPLNGVVPVTVFDEQGEAGVAHEGGVGKDGADDLRVFAFVTGFLAQFADTGGGGGGIGGVNHAAGDFQFHGVGALAILLDHDKLIVGGGGDDVNPVRAINDVEIVLRA